MRKQRAGLRPRDRAPAALYADAVNRATYAELGALAAAGAAGGVIVDATFRHRADRDAFRAAAGDIPLLFVECRAPAAVLIGRARARARDAAAVSDAGVEVVRDQLAAHDALDELPPRDHVIVRSDDTIAALVGAVSDAVETRLSRPPR